MGEGFEIRTEFGTVQVHLDTTANGPRLRLVGQESGTEICLDVVEIEALTAMRHADFRAIIAAQLGRLGEGV
ncbi:hypothetical protein [Amycolatopsis jejuensis]|uniref:hypothetical protein n=1 Tax=Amycolatopsis jejuensis TaxID=330084 RepID=UPI00052532F6|nr:hypothetical protein [Amycolatopsis jejuensis]